MSNKPNVKFIRKWVEALRSRKYKQGQGKLRTKRETRDSVDRFCCLGVACDIKGVKHDNCHDGYFYYYDDIDGSLSTSMLEYIGISNEEENELIDMNDGGKKFYQIARWLE